MSHIASIPSGYAHPLPHANRGHKAMIPENVLVPDDDPEDECALCGEPCVGRLCRECHDELTADAAMERCD